MFYQNTILQRKLARMMSSKKSFQKLQFTNTAVSELRVDPNNTNETRQVDGFHYSLTPLTGLKKPQIVCLSQYSCELLDLDPEKVKQEADYLIGNKLPAEAKVIYCKIAHFSLLCWVSVWKPGRPARRRKGYFAWRREE